VQYARHDPLLVCRIFGALDAFQRNARRKLLTPAPRTVMGSDDELFGKGIVGDGRSECPTDLHREGRAISGGSAFPIWRATWSRGRTNSNSSGNDCNRAASRNVMPRSYW
jgi:hypothetical protein